MKKLLDQWRKGPVDDIFIDAHDRPITCMRVHPNEREFVTGSQDHGLKIFDLKTCKQKRELYTRKYGHKEWVTCVDYATDGRIVSGGMDNKLCVWASVGVSCVDLLGHRGSISAVKCSENNIALSSSYDKTLKLWDLDSYQCIQTFETSGGHKKAVLKFLWEGSLIISGDREGRMCLWDVNDGSLVTSLSEHAAPITCLDFILNDHNVFISGGMDGIVGVFDLRQCDPVARVHCINGSVNCVKITDRQNENSKIIVGGSDRTIQILDPRKNFKVVQKVEEHKDIITDIKIYEDLILSAGGNGWVLVHDMNGNCLYGVGATEKEVPCVCLEIIPPNYFVSGGEDGKVIVFSFS